MPGEDLEPIGNAKGDSQVARGTLLRAASDHHEPRRPCPLEVGENLDGVGHSLLGDEASDECKHDLLVRQGLSPQP